MKAYKGKIENPAFGSALGNKESISFLISSLTSPFGPLPLVPYPWAGFIESAPHRSRNCARASGHVCAQNKTETNSHAREKQHDGAGVAHKF